ncbi:ribosome-associated translation inhibitor RaiA [Gordonia sp. X0973]|uniref:ribosome hibernation-promoting factor, HPF/YfiA family n=1 Tax=Gordonia sp. X0973 TaxID=2742602 RepID=UPI000F51FDED|nr:ribosome-associated translation inhibitor RaiA [Gordonia sp. X0973]QKT08124.1 ribosome-associated translation inhibitor RaiA [Gordonia sp. X0973]
MSTVIHRKGHRESKANHTREADTSFDAAAAFKRPPGTQVSSEPAEPNASVTFSGRNVEIPEHYRVYVGDKLARLERYDPTITRFDVQLYHERNRRQAKACQQVELTAFGKGPVVRSQAGGENFYAALELALDRLGTRLRRAKSRKEISYGLRTPTSLAEATATGAGALAGSTADTLAAAARDQEKYEVDGHEPGQIVRTKEHSAVPMTVDDALYEMELVGHDFFLFHDKESDRPSVVYRRHAFDYGLIRLV